MKKLVPFLLIPFIAISCGEKKEAEKSSEELNQLHVKIEQLQEQVETANVGQNGQITTFLTFQENNAEAAMNFYVSLFDNSKILDIQRYGKDGPAKEGSILMAKFELNGSPFICSDSYIQHDWGFTPAVSNFVECKGMLELEKIYDELSRGGVEIMPLDNYGYGQKFGFIEDKFGVSWQLILY